MRKSVFILLLCLFCFAVSSCGPFGSAENESADSEITGGTLTFDGTGFGQSAFFRSSGCDLRVVISRSGSGNLHFDVIDLADGQSAGGFIADGGDIETVDYVPPGNYWAEITADGEWRAEITGCIFGVTVEYPEGGGGSDGGGGGYSGCGQGCCSSHGGVSGCECSTGRCICGDGSYSPSCTCSCN